MRFPLHIIKQNCSPWRCRRNFYYPDQIEDGLCCGSDYIDDYPEIVIGGSTPEIAVANLWLALQNSPEKKKL